MNSFKVLGDSTERRLLEANVTLMGELQTPVIWIVIELPCTATSQRADCKEARRILMDCWCIGSEDSPNQSRSVAAVVRLKCQVTSQSLSKGERREPGNKHIESFPHSGRPVPQKPSAGRLNCPLIIGAHASS